METQNKPLNRYGVCPNKECETAWDGGDILANLRQLHALTGKSEQELVNLAIHGYGYNPKAPKNFSKVIAVSVVQDRIASEVQLETKPQIPPDFYMCPNCRQVWDADTGEEYTSIQVAKIKKYGIKSDSKQFFDPFEEETTE